MNRRTLTSIVLLCLVSLILPESVKLAPIAADEAAFSLRGDDFYFDFAAKLGEYRYERAFAPDEYTIMRVDAYPKNKSTLGDHCYGELFCMKYVAGAHRVDVERLEGYWLIKLDGKLHGAAIFSKEGLEKVTASGLEIVSLSCQAHVHPLPEGMLRIRGLQYLCGVGGSFSPESISSSNLAFVEGLSGDDLPRYTRPMYNASYGIRGEPANWRAIADVIKPVSLDLWYTHGCLPVPPPDKRLVLRILNEIPESVRYLQLTLIDCWSIRDNILSILGSKKNLRYLSLAFETRAESGPCEGEISIDVHGLSTLCLSFSHHERMKGLVDSYPFVVLKGNLASLKVLDISGGKLVVDPLGNSGVESLFARGTFLTSVGAPPTVPFHPRKIYFYPPEIGNQTAKEASFSIFLDMLQHAEDASFPWVDLLQGKDTSFPSVRILSHHFQSLEDVNHVPWEKLKTTFPNLRDLFISAYDGILTTSIDGSALSHVRLWTVSDGEAGFSVWRPAENTVVVEIRLDDRGLRSTAEPMSPEGPLD
ncbi:MAG: hypothetical protein WC712_03565 [Candidatus Brocadiia bacterium]